MVTHFILSQFWQKQSLSMEHPEINFDLGGNHVCWKFGAAVVNKEFEGRLQQVVFLPNENAIGVVEDIEGHHSGRATVWEITGELRWTIALPQGVPSDAGFWYFTQQPIGTGLVVASQSGDMRWTINSNGVLCHPVRAY